VPRLRFPEFKSNREWEKKTIAQIGDIVTGNTPKTTDAENYGGERLFITPGDITSTKVVVNTKTTLSEEGYSKTRKIPAYSILFVCIGSTIGKIAQNKFDCATNQQINAVIPFGGFASEFIYYALDLNSNKIAQLAGKQAVPIINKTLFSSVALYIPVKEEQQKIADCLSPLDDLIAAENKKLEVLRTHKKGLMQKLFPAEGETVPEARFEGYDGTWERRKLGDVVRIYSGWSPSEFDIGEDELFIKVDDLNHSERVQKNSQLKVKSHKKYTLIKSGSTVFAKRGAAIMTNKVRMLGKDAYMDTNMMALEPKGIEAEFLFALVSRVGLFKIADTSTIPQINNKHIEPYVVVVPTQSKEQVVISGLLRNIDELITAQTEKIKALKQHKKGLMQRLFPSAQEMTE
ncbi:MAG: restriction endonuclease subunit S, partial [Treponema sp.]|nr:restriction endonuclease subunit S [Treponema sp.]